MLLEHIGVDLDRQERAHTMKLSRAVRAATKGAWRPQRGKHPQTGVRCRGFLKVQGESGQPQPVWTPSDNLRPNSRPDLNPLLAIDHSCLDNMDILFFER